MMIESTGAIRDDFIHAMRSVAASVTVVTTDGAAGRLGATVSAFTSVSADPPTVLVCLRAQSRIARAVTQNMGFCVNVLPDHGDGIADRFAGFHDTQVTDRFDEIHCHGTPPRIDGATTFTCAVDQIVPAASHLVVFGLVQQVRNGGVEPLTYLNGAYHKVTPKLAFGALN